MRKAAGTGQASRRGRPGQAPEAVGKAVGDKAVGDTANAPTSSDVLGSILDEAATREQGAMVLRRRADMFEDADIGSILSRASAYLDAGAAVHFRGPAGAGKTTLAFEVAARLGRPVEMVSGDASLTSADLLGREVGTDAEHVRDRYIQSVTRTRTETRVAWQEGALARAMCHGRTLIYDEFTRAAPAANNALLSALEERILVLPHPVLGGKVLRAHPDFRVILTSNPQEYVGVEAAPDALYDRMVTFDLTWCAPCTEAGIVARRTGLAREDCDHVVRLVRALRDRPGSSAPPSLRAALMIGRIVAAVGARADAGDERFVQICLDVLETRAPQSAGPEERRIYLDDLREEISRICPAGPKGVAKKENAA